MLCYVRVCVCVCLCACVCVINPHKYYQWQSADHKWPMQSQYSTAMSSSNSVCPLPTLGRRVWSHPKCQHKTSPAHRLARNLPKCSLHLHSGLCYGSKTIKSKRNCNKELLPRGGAYRLDVISASSRYQWCKYLLRLHSTCSATSTAMSVNATGIRNRVKAKRSANASRA